MEHIQDNRLHTIRAGVGSCSAPSASGSIGRTCSGFQVNLAIVWLLKQPKPRHTSLDEKKNKKIETEGSWSITIYQCAACMYQRLGLVFIGVWANRERLNSCFQAALNYAVGTCSRVFNCQHAMNRLQLDTPSRSTF